MKRLTHRSRIAGLLAILVLASAGSAQHVATDALSAPRFLEVEPGTWSVFPGATAALAVRDSGVILRSRSSERALTLEFPEGWRVRPAGKVGTTYRVIRPGENRVLRAAPGLVFESPDGSARTTLSMRGSGALLLSRSASSGAPLALLRLHGELDPEAEAWLAAQAASSDGATQRWTRNGPRQLQLVESGAEEGNSNPLPQPLVFGTFLGGSGSEGPTFLAVTESGDLVIVGSTNSFDYPTTPGAVDTTVEGFGDMFLAGLTRDGSELTFATLFGASLRDLARYVLVEPGGTLLVAGRTESPDLVTTPGAFDETWNGDKYTVFLARFSADGSALLQSTYIGGSDAGAEEIHTLQRDPRDGSVVISGSTCSQAWPTTPGTLLTDAQGACKGFLTRLSGDLSSLLSSTYIGSASPIHESGGTARLAADGSILFRGGADAPPNGVPFTLEGSGAFPDATADDRAYLASLTPDLAGSNWATWLPGFAGAVPLPDGTISLTGRTGNHDFPTTKGVFVEDFGGGVGGNRLFACRITADANQLLWSTFMTTASGASLSQSRVDSMGRLFIVGRSLTTNLPFTPDAFDTTLTGFSEPHILVLESDGTDVLYSSLIGVGASDELIFRLALDDCGGAFVTGRTTAPDFPTTEGAFDPTFDGSSDTWIVRITALSPWRGLGGALPGVQGRPELAGTGQLCDLGADTSILLRKGPPLGTSFLVVGLTEVSVPLKGGVLIPALDVVRSLPLDASGAAQLNFPWSVRLPSGFQIWLQGWQPDASAPLGFSATNGVLGTVP